MKIATLTFFSILFLGVTTLFSQTVLIHDPLAKTSSEETGQSIEENLIKKTALAKAVVRWKDDSSCNGEGMSVIGKANGSFTKAGAKQTVIVYEVCQIGNGLANNGYAIFEGGKLIANFTESGGWNTEVSFIADINQNGLDEIAVETGGGMHQGYTGSSVTILEFSSTAVKELAGFIVYSNECGKGEKGEFCDKSYKITAKKGKVPAFFQQKYIDASDGDTPKWVVSGKTVPAKTIALGKPDYRLEK